MKQTVLLAALFLITLFVNAQNFRYRIQWPSNGTWYIQGSPIGAYFITIRDASTGNIAVPNWQIPANTAVAFGGLIGNAVYEIEVFDHFDNFREFYWNTSRNDRSRLVEIMSWGNITWRKIDFENCVYLEINANANKPSLSITNGSLAKAFKNCTYIYNFPDLHIWDVSNITNFSEMFSGCTNFTGSISQWDIRNGQNFSNMFSGCQNFNSLVSGPTGLNPINATNLSGMFDGARKFNQPLNWNTANVTDFSNMFKNANAFNQSLNWNTSAAQNFQGMFESADIFDAPLTFSSTGSVTNMQQMFFGANKFNQNISGWNVANVTNMQQMFKDAYFFNQNIAGWNVSKVTNMSNMFTNAYSFNQNLGSWQINQLTNAAQMFTPSAMSCNNYSATLIGWAANSNVQNNVSFGIGARFGADAVLAKNTLSNSKNWTITDGGIANGYCIIETSNNITICEGTTVNLTASGGTSYNWTGPNNFTSNTQNPSITNIATNAGGTYTVAVPLASGGSAIGNVAVNVVAATWNGTDWSTPCTAPNSNTADAVIASNTTPASFTCRTLTINSGVALNTTGITVTINGDILNNGNGITGNGNLVIAGNSTINGYRFTFAGNINLLAGTLNTTGLLRIAPTGAITGNYANIRGSVTLQQNIAGQRGWRIFANPFISTQNIALLANVNGIAINTTPGGASGLTDIRRYTNGSGWNNITTNTLAANAPYALFIRGLANEVSGVNYTGGPTPFTYNVSGTLNNSSLTIISSASGFTLVGNPFAAPVNSSALTNGESKSYYVYQIARNGDGRTRSGGWSAVLSSSNTTPIPTLGVIAYQAGTATSYSVSSISDINTTNAAATGLFRTQDNNAPARTAAVIENLALQIEQNGVLQDNLFIRQDEASSAIETDTKDLAKLTNDNVNFYTIAKANNKRLAIDARDVRKDNSSIALGIVAVQGNYTIKVTNQNIDKVEASLVDKYLNSRTVLTPNTTYNFSITADSNSRGNNRFEVVFNNKLTSTESITPNGNAFTAKLLGNINLQNEVTVQVANAAKQVSIMVTDMQGKVLATKQGTNGINKVQVALTSGIYLVQVSDGTTTITEKIMN